MYTKHRNKSLEIAMKRYLEGCEDGYKDMDALKRVYKLSKEELGIITWVQYLFVILLLLLVSYIF